MQRGRGRGRGPRTGRRHSLPAIQSPLGLARALPEGSDTFQQALDDLYNHDPAPALTTPSHPLNRLSNIVEGDEEEREEDECDPIEEVRRLNTRRFSSPVVISQEEIDALRGRAPRDGATTQKKYINTSKEYFIKHGHWPNKAAMDVKHTHLQKNATASGVAFGTTSTKSAKLKA